MIEGCNVDEKEKNVTRQLFGVFWNKTPLFVISNGARNLTIAERFGIPALARG